MAEPPPPGDLEQAYTGCLLGAAVGDALGLPREGLSARAAERLFGPEIRHALVFGRGMVSDDTEHAAMTALSMITSSDTPEAFGRALARRLRWWVLALPAGVGLATARSCMRLWLGRPPSASGVYSAGNGPMMRAPIIGLHFAEDPGRMREFVGVSTRITHTDPRAEQAAQIVALAVSYTLRHPAAEPSGADVIAEARELVPDLGDELRQILDRALDPAPLTEHWPAGPTGYCCDTLLAVLHSWLRVPQSFRSAMQTVLCLGGDADTTGAVLGGILGANLGAQAIPAQWLAAVREWPCSMRWLTEVAQALADTRSDVGQRPPRCFWPAVPGRNLLFLLVVLSHGVYRLMRLGSLRA